MYVFNLCPLPVKSITHLYSWLSIPATKNFPPDEVILLGAQWQLVDPATLKFQPWITQLAGTPDSARWAAARKIQVPTDLIQRIADSELSGSALLKRMTSTGFQEYRDWLYATLRNIHEKDHIDAVVSLVNCRTTEDVCRYLGIPVIHQEAGYIREPVFKFSTFAFDFSGVNGNTEAEQRFHKWIGESPAHVPLSSEEILRFSLRSYPPAHQCIDQKYEFGIALQVEDDSNILCYSNSIDAVELIYRARQIFPPNKILIRTHPLAKFKYNWHDNFGEIDTSKSSLEFISKCRRVLTINSSVGFESLLMDVPTYVLGQSPFSFSAHNVVDRRVLEQLSPDLYLSRKIDFLFFNYLCPRSIWMDKKYFDFRLSFPPEISIRKYHERAFGFSGTRGASEDAIGTKA